MLSKKSDIERATSIASKLLHERIASQSSDGSVGRTPEDRDASNWFGALPRLSAGAIPSEMTCSNFIAVFDVYGASVEVIWRALNVLKKISIQISFV